eukprot:6212381-Pleurochrysis_carterae.AAC.4
MQLSDATIIYSFDCYAVPGTTSHMASIASAANVVELRTGVRADAVDEYRAVADAGVHVAGVLRAAHLVQLHTGVRADAVDEYRAVADAGVHVAG